MAFPKPLDWNKIYTCTQKPSEPVHDYSKQFQIVFKESSGLPMDVKYIQVDFRSMFTNRLNQNLSLLVKETSIEWETMSTPVLVNLANLFAC